LCAEEIFQQPAFENFISHTLAWTFLRETKQKAKGLHLLTIQYQQLDIVKPNIPIAI